MIHMFTSRTGLRRGLALCSSSCLPGMELVDGDELGEPDHAALTPHALRPGTCSSLRQKLPLLKSRFLTSAQNRLQRRPSSSDGSSRPRSRLLFPCSTGREEPPPYQSGKKAWAAGWDTNDPCLLRARRAWAPAGLRIARAQEPYLRNLFYPYWQSVRARRTLFWATAEK